MVERDCGQLEKSGRGTGGRSSAGFAGTLTPLDANDQMFPGSNRSDLTVDTNFYSGQDD